MVVSLKTDSVKGSLKLNGVGVVFYWRMYLHGSFVKYKTFNLRSFSCSPACTLDMVMQLYSNVRSE